MERVVLLMKLKECPTKQAFLPEPPTLFASCIYKQWMSETQLTKKNRESICPPPTTKTHSNIFHHSSLPGSSLQISLPGAAPRNQLSVPEARSLPLLLLLHRPHKQLVLRPIKLHLWNISQIPTFFPKAFSLVLAKRSSLDSHHFALEPHLQLHFFLNPAFVHIHPFFYFLSGRALPFVFCRLTFSMETFQFNSAAHFHNANHVVMQLLVNGLLFPWPTWVRPKMRCLAPYLHFQGLNRGLSQRPAISTFFKISWHI